MDLEQIANDFFSLTTGLSFEQLLRPISDSQPSGNKSGLTAIYNKIIQARSEDNIETSPVWQYEFKRADWEEVVKMSSLSLANQIKDLQLVAWLLESSIKRHGLYGITPCFILLGKLSEQYWENIYPLPEDKTFEKRKKIFSWIDTKLIEIVKSSPLNPTGSDIKYCWLDVQKVTEKDYLKAFRMTSAYSFIPLRTTLFQAVESIERTNASLKFLLMEDRDYFRTILSLLKEILIFIELELEKREDERFNRE